jgi:signal transduction histidine kinase
MKKEKILIVDDKQENLISLETILNDFNLEFVRAYSGEEALKQTLKEEFALAILDVQMPGMDGYETLELMRHRKKTKYLPVIFVSAIHQSDLHIIKGIETGAVDFIPKPIIPEILRGKVKVFLDLYRQKQELNQLLKYVESKNEELVIARNKAEDATRTKSLFLANMSHEIRSPMNGILGLSRLLLKSELNQDQKEMLSAMATSGEHLLQIINDILDYSKIEARQIDFEHIDFDLRKVTNTIYQLLHFKAIEKGLDFIIKIDEDIPQLVNGDHYRINQILMNLVNNALKFTAKGFVKLRVSILEKDDEAISLLFSVKDSGIGISGDAQKKLFQEFTQSESSTTRRFGGTGLGLAISKNLVQLMGGTIGVSSEVGEGSNFWFKLKLAHSSQQNQQVKENTMEIPSDISILVAEDNPLNRKVAQLTLKHMGLQCDFATNGQEAFEQYKDKRHQLILMDMQMPIIDGIEATEMIRRFEKEENINPSCCIVALTANAFIEDRQRCIESGMNDFISKPFKEEDIQKVLYETAKELEKQSLSFS